MTRDLPLPFPKSGLKVLTTLLASLALGSLAAQAQTIPSDAVSLPDLDGGRWGVSVVSLDGEQVFGLSEHQRFAPASTLKLVTTSAAFRLLGDFDSGRWPGGTSVNLESVSTSPYPNLVLKGAGDPSLSATGRCEGNCLQLLADAVAESGVTDIAAIDVDDSLFQPPHWPTGWTPRSTGLPRSAMSAPLRKQHTSWSIRLPSSTTSERKPSPRRKRLPKSPNPNHNRLAPIFRICNKMQNS